MQFKASLYTLYIKSVSRRPWSTSFENSNIVGYVWSQNYHRMDYFELPDTILLSNNVFYLLTIRDAAHLLQQICCLYMNLRKPMFVAFATVQPGLAYELVKNILNFGSICLKSNNIPPKHLVTSHNQVN